MTLCVKIERVDSFSTYNIYVCTYIPRLYCYVIAYVDCVENAAPTSRVCASPTVVQMITKYHILWHHAALQWHKFMTKNLYYQ